MIRLLGTVVALLFATPLSAPVWAQPLDPASLRGDSPQTYKRLLEAEQKLLAGKAADAIDDLQRILDESAGDLISGDGKLYRPAQWFTQHILTKLPPDALKTYQDQVEVPARKLLDTARKTRETAPLWQLLDRYFVSRPAAEGSVLLGDLLFEQGEFRAAQTVWRRLIPGSGELCHPGPALPLAPVAARLVLAAIFEGDYGRAKTEIEEFQKKYGNENGTLAGKTGRLAAILAEQLQAAPQVRSVRNDGASWPTFGGGNDHTAGVGARIPAEWDSQPKVMRLPLHGQNSYQTPFGNPVVIDGHLFVTNGSQLCDFDLSKAELSASEDLPHTRTAIKVGDKLPPDPCPSLSAVGDRLYVRTGPAVFGDGGQGNDKVGASWLICYAVRPGTVDRFRKLWSLSPPAGDGKAQAVWEGAPVVAGRRLWAAYARFDGGRVVHGIACYDPADLDLLPKAAEAKNLRPASAWVAEVCESTLTPANENRARQELVTLAGRHVVFCSNNGAVVALDAMSGRRSWAFRYSRSREVDPNRFSDPAPAIDYGGRLFVAPADSTHVFALDPETGTPLWDYATAHGSRLVGAAAGKVFLERVGQSPHTHELKGIDAAAGPDPLGADWQPQFPTVRASGLGFVTDDVVVWPTTGGVYCISIRDGHTRLVLSGTDGQPGNVVYADGVIAQVTSTRVFCYRSEDKSLGRANSPLTGDTARLHFLRLTALVERRLASGDSASARGTLVQAAGADLPAPYRAWAFARLLLLSPKSHDQRELPDDLRGIPTHELQNEWVFTAAGEPVTLGMLLDRQLGREPPAVESAVRTVQRVEPRCQLAADLEVARTRRLGTGAVPLLPIAGSSAARHIYFSTPAEIHALAMTSGEDSRYVADSPFTHVSETPVGFVTAGPLAVALYATARRPVWEFRVPITDPLPPQPGELRFYTADPPPPLELADFRLQGSWLLARLGPHHLIAFDLHRRQVAWVLGTDRATGYRSRGTRDTSRFGSAFSLGPRYTVAQLSDGRRWMIETETGRVADAPAFAEQTAQGWWTVPPVQIEDTLILPDGPGLVRAVKLHSRTVKWTFSEPRRELSLSGASPQVRAWGEVLVVAVRRNYGVEVTRLDLDTGRPIWREGPLFLDVDHLSLAAADVDGGRLYLRAGNTLMAADLATGKTAWEADLPECPNRSDWVIRASGKAVLAYPLEAIPREPAAAVWARLRQSFLREPAAWRLPGMAMGLYGAWVARTVPLLTFGSEAGHTLGKIEIPARGPAIAVCLDRDRAAIATAGRVIWVK